MTTAYLDCEWDSGGTERTISIGLFVSQEPRDGAYFVDAEAARSATNEWVKANVIPALESPSHPANTLTARNIGYWLIARNIKRIVADWPEDIARLCSALVLRKDGVPQAICPRNLTFEVNRNLSSADSVQPHNAIHDAEAIWISSLDP